MERVKFPSLQGWRLKCKVCGHTARRRLAGTDECVRPYTGSTAEAGCRYVSNLSSTVFFVLFQDEGVGHAGNVVADYARESFVLRFFLILMGK